MLSQRFLSAAERPKPLTRRERAENVKKRDVFTKYGPQARAVLDALLEKYRDEGMLNLDNANVLKVTPSRAIGTPRPFASAKPGFGGYGIILLTKPTKINKFGQTIACAIGNAYQHSELKSPTPCPTQHKNI
jgi:type I site-specific restriction endonuclease